MERRLHLFWPLVLIASGAIWILINTRVIPASNLWALTYLWPFLLIAAGLGLILRPYWRYAGATMSLVVVGGLFLGVLFAAQLGWNRVPVEGPSGAWFFVPPNARGSGHVITQTRDVRDFTSIHVDYPAMVLIRQGTAESLTIEAEDNVVAAIRTQVVNHVLEIDSVRDHTVYLAATRPVNITITVKDLSDLDFNSAGDITVQGLHTTALRVTLDGAGSIRLEDVQLGSFDGRLQGVGSLQANGTAENLDIRVDGMGSFNGGELRSQSATVSLNGLGSADVWADRKLTADVNGLGSVNYSGNAQVTKSVNGLGTVNFTGSK